MCALKVFDLAGVKLNAIKGSSEDVIGSSWGVGVGLVPVPSKTPPSASLTCAPVNANKVVSQS